jgi:hypothetical protein
MTIVEGFRPTWKSMLKAALWTNVYALAIYFVNIALGSNYLMVNAKPDVPSLLAGAMAESADATDLKSVGGDTVRVRPPLAPSHLSLRATERSEAISY